MSGRIAVYGVSVLIAGARKFGISPNTLYLPISFLRLWTMKPHNYSLFAGFIHPGACRYIGLAAAYAIDLIGEARVLKFGDAGKFFSCDTVFKLCAKAKLVQKLLCCIQCATISTEITHQPDHHLLGLWYRYGYPSGLCKRRRTVYQGRI